MGEPGAEAIELPEEEAQQLKELKAPEVPTKAEVDRHRVSHLPYRSWCPDCVEAFGREWAHSISDGQRSIPLISCDYLFVTPRGALQRPELQEGEEEHALKVLVAYCGATKCMFAHAVPKKGVDPAGYIVEQLKQDVLWLGHSRVVIKGDNEPSLVQVIETTLSALKMAGITSASNGDPSRMTRKPMGQPRAQCAFSREPSRPIY